MCQKHLFSGVKYRLCVSQPTSQPVVCSLKSLKGIFLALKLYLEIKNSLAAKICFIVYC